jgi:Tol biopolymer transport system component
MALNPGSRLGAYEILAAIGAGSTGEVYRARDTRVDRIVALKVFPPQWADNAELRERFDRAADALRDLNHPNICVPHETGRDRPAGSDAPVDFLIMEYLDGETLTARLDRGALGPDEALKLGLQIVDALDKAHRSGVVHGDLKPSNVMLTPGGIKLLDFGMAPFRAGGSGGFTAQPTRTDLTTPAAMIGAVQYMAPEQLEGIEADARTDIFAFGVIMHEMVTGKRAFVGKSQVLLISAIATSQPPSLSKIDPAASPALDHVVQVCLAKDPSDRWQTARDLLAELEWIAEGGARTAAAAAGRRSARPRGRLYRALIPAGALVGAAAVAPAALYLRGSGAEPELRFRVPIQLTADTRVAGGRGRGGTGGAGQGGPGITGVTVFNPANFAVSPDGRAIAFVARQAPNESWMLFVRPINALTPQRLAGTEAAAQPFWSADSRWIGFVRGGKVKRVEASGGPPQEICSAPSFAGGAWNTDGTIVFGSAQGVFRVAAEGGRPELVTTPDEGEKGHFWPAFLPDGRRFLYTAWSAEQSQGAIMAGSLGSQEKTRVLAVGSNAAYTNPGIVLFHRGSAVYAQPFDPKSLALSGEPARVADEVTFDDGNGRGDFAVSRNGVLVYFYASAGGTLTNTPSSELSEWQLSWVDRGAQVLGSVGPPGAYRGVELSPDARRIAVHRHDTNGGDIYVIEPRGSLTRLTRDASRHNSMPIWSPDGSRIAYSSRRNGKWGLYETLSSGSGTEELLYESDLRKAPMSWSPDAKRIVFWVDDPKTGSDLWAITLDDKKAAPLVATPFNETHAQISPDGKWLAYADDSKDGRREIYVKPFPAGSGGWQVSFTGGDWPRWRTDSRELFYHSLVSNISGAGGALYPYGGPLFSVPVTTNGGVFEPGSPQEIVVFPAVNVPHNGGDYHPYAVSPDGQRFLTVQFVLSTPTASDPIGPDAPRGLTVAVNWAEGVKKGRGSTK